MFYDKLIEICNERGVKPTPVLRKLGISPGNLKRWAGGASVNSDTLIKLSEHFKVPTDYFLYDEPPVDNRKKQFLEAIRALIPICFEILNSRVDLCRVLYECCKKQIKWFNQIEICLDIYTAQDSLRYKLSDVAYEQKQFVNDTLKRLHTDLELLDKSRENVMGVFSSLFGEQE